jgi:two-component system invasion response regulator UvrY
MLKVGNLSPGGDMDVLVVDDQTPFRTVARALIGLIPRLRLAAEASSGEEAVEIARRLHPSLVLMDINLPGISGIEATRQILADDPSVTVILMSTYSAGDLPSDAMDSGAAGYVHKEDITPSAILALIPA